MGIYRIKIGIEDLKKICYVRLPKMLEAQSLSLHIASQLEGEVQDVTEIQEQDFLAEIQQAHFIYLE